MSLPDARGARPPFAMLVAVTALGPLALNIIMPSMPGLPDVFQSDYATVQLTLSVYLIGFAVSQLAYGPLSDRFGRRPVMLAGLSVFVLASVVCLAAPTVEVLIAGRLLQGMGSCAGMVLARAIVRDMHDRERSATLIAYITMAMVVAPMLAPLIGGYLDEWVGWWASFLFTAVAGVAVLATAVVALHETNHNPQPMPGIGGLLVGFRRLLAMPVFTGYAVQTAVTSAAFFGFLGGAPYVIVEIMDRPPREYGLYFLTNAAGYMLGNLVAGKASARIGIDRMIGYGVCLSLAAALVMVALALQGMVTPMAVFAPMVLFAVGNGFSIPTGVAGAVSVNPKLAGTASGLAGFLQMGLGAAASAVVGHLVESASTQLPLVASMATTSALAVVAWLGTLWAIRRTASVGAATDTATEWAGGAGRDS